MKRLLLKLRYSKLKMPLFIIVMVFFGLSFLSIPLFSFIPKFYALTWVFTVGYLGSALLYTFIFTKFKIDTIVMSFVAFCLSALISSLFSGFKGFVATPLTLTIVSTISYITFAGEKKFYKYLYYVLLGTTTIFAIVFIFYYRSYFFSLSFTRLGDDFGDINDICIFFGLGFFLSFYGLFFRKKIYDKIICLFTILIATLCGMSTGSKIFIFIVITTLIGVICMFFGKKRWWASLILIAGFIGLSILLINLPIFSTMKNRILVMFSTLTGESIEGTSSNDMSTIGRVQMFEDGMQLFLRRPLFGFGINAFFTYSSYGGAWSHNHFSETFCSFGLIGTVFFHYGFYESFRQIIKKPDREKALYILLLVFFMTMMLSVALNSQKIYAYLVGIAFAGIVETKQIFGLCIEETKNENSRDNTES